MNYMPQGNRVTKTPKRYYDTSDILTYGSGDNTEIMSVLRSNINGIFGLPYQFMESVDPRITGTDVGAKYAEKIISRWPLLFLTPCKQIFMKDFDQTDQENALYHLINGGTLNVSGSGKYYTTQFNYDEYYDYVNKMMTALCYFTGLGDERVGIDGNSQLKNVAWQNVNSDAFKSYFNAKEAVIFYLDGLTSMSENFSNSTTESSLASTINGYSDQANELKFLLGDDSALTKAAASLGEGIGDSISSILSNFSSVTGGMLTDLASTGVSTVLTGGKIVFPKIWQESGFSRSYSFDIKLRSPDHDSLSILLNVLAPFIHLLGFVLPKNLEDGNPNGYTSPNLVKAYCKGMFNIDMGIITDMSVTRGAECQWNDDGLPTQIDVSITIEDLYSSLFMSNSTFNVAVVKNTALMDYMANLAGLNIADVEFGRRTKMLAYMDIAGLGRLDSTIFSKFDNAVANVLSNVYNLL